MKKPLRKSVPTKGLHHWLASRWKYIKPDFDKANCSIIEWDCEDEPSNPGEDIAAELLRDAT